MFYVGPMPKINSERCMPRRLVTKNKKFLLSGIFKSVEFARYKPVQGRPLLFSENILFHIRKLSRKKEIFTHIDGCKSYQNSGKYYFVLLKRRCTYLKR